MQLNEVLPVHPLAEESGDDRRLRPPLDLPGP